MDRLKRAVVPGLLLVAVYYAFFGGSYSYFDLRSARAEVAAEAMVLAELEIDIDSLGAYLDSLETDPRTLERVARERYGMIREGETLYKFVPGEPTAEPEVGPAR